MQLTSTMSSKKYAGEHYHSRQCSPQCLPFVHTRYMEKYSTLFMNPVQGLRSSEAGLRETRNKAGLQERGKGSEQASILRVCAYLCVARNGR
jgi:hypothetical protein